MLGMMTAEVSSAAPQHAAGASSGETAIRMADIYSQHFISGSEAVLPFKRLWA